MIYTDCPNCAGSGVAFGKRCTCAAPVCCNQNYNQGRDCPLREEKSDESVISSVAATPPATAMLIGVNFIFASGHRHAISTEHSNRRFFIIDQAAGEPCPHCNGHHTLSQCPTWRLTSRITPFECHSGHQGIIFAAPRKCNCTAGKICMACATTSTAALSAQQASGSIGDDELHFNAQRLRNVAELVGCAILPEVSDYEVDELRGAFLGIIASKLRERAATPAQPIAPPNFAAVIEALRFYAEGQHFVLHDADVFDTVSGEPQNWQEDESNTIMFEDGSVAKLALDAYSVAQPIAVSAPTDDMIAFGASLLGSASITDRLDDKEALAWVRKQWAEWQADRAATQQATPVIYPMTDFGPVDSSGVSDMSGTLQTALDHIAAAPSAQQAAENIDACKFIEVSFDYANARTYAATYAQPIAVSAPTDERFRVEVGLREPGQTEDGGLSAAIIADANRYQLIKRHAFNKSCNGFTGVVLQWTLTMPASEDDQSCMDAAVDDMFMFYGDKYHYAAPKEPAAQGGVPEAVNRFLGWPLPKTFGPDCGISFDGRKDDEWNKNKPWPIGTNLFTADEARTMFEYCLGEKAK